MKNIERQKSLDKLKWLNSEDFGYDLSGLLPYCECCEARRGNDCVVSQAEREANCYCARAYNRMVRGDKK